MRQLKLLVVGAGNVATHRHLPYIMSRPDLFSVVGLFDRHPDRAKALAQKYSLPVTGRPAALFKTADAVIITTPPFAHADLVEQALLAGKPVLVEKPFVVDLSAGARLVKLAKSRHLILAINHSFQYASAFMKLKALIKTDTLGPLQSILCQQFSNTERRLPVWADQLPGGLFYDESPHFLYLIKMLSPGKLKCVSAWQTPAHGLTTPQILVASLIAGRVPVTIYTNFRSPICEWYFIAIFARRYVLVDFFRDILISLPSDGIHLSQEVIRTSWLATWQHWSQYFQNGPKYLTGRLRWGFNEIYDRFYRSVSTGDPGPISPFTGAIGLEVNRLQWEIIYQARKPSI